LNSVSGNDRPVSARPDQRLFDQVCDRLRSAIISGQLEPGQRMRERELTERLEVSRTPIREAFRKLEIEGLVVSFPHRGFFVRNPSFEEAKQAYEMRRILDSACCELAALRANEIDIATLRQAIREAKEAVDAEDREAVLSCNRVFHLSLARAAHNDFLERQWVAMWAFADLLRGQGWNHPSRMKSWHQEHTAILETIVEKDAAKARDLADEHVRLAWDKIADQYQERTQ
jgi:DNA-binding GntR family transcriptional regulator